MSSIKHKVRRLPRYRAKVQGKKVAEIVGRGKTDAHAARKVNIENALALKKVSGKAVREFDGLGLDELKAKLSEARKELFNKRFEHATGQLASVATLPATRRRIARILTLIKQKEVVGA